MAGPAVRIEMLECENGALVVDMVAETPDHALTEEQKKLIAWIPALYGAPDSSRICRDLTTAGGDKHTEINVQRVRDMMEDINPLVDPVNLPHQIAVVLMEHGYPVELDPDPRPIEQRGEYFFSSN